MGTATTARSFKPADVRPTDGPIESTDGGSIEVAAHAENVGYRFSFQNTSHARSDESTITLDVQGIARRGAEDEDNTVRGFRTKTVEVSADILKLGTNRDGSTAFEKALLFFLDPTTGEQAGGAFEMDAQAVQSALASADSFTLTVGEGMLADRAGQYLSKIELRYASIDPVTSGATLGIELTGKADWYDDHVAAQTFEQKGAFDTRIPSSQKAVLRVERPAAELHTYVQYATADDGTECEDPNYTNRGGSDDNTRTQVVVPYDRDFTMWATVQNERNVSVLDDLDVVLTMPLKYETGIKQEDGSTVDAWTGFHVTSFTVNQDILSCFPQGQVGTIRLTGYAPDADANASAVAKELRPVADPSASWDAGDTTLSGNEVAGFVDERGTFYPVENGQVTIEESAVAALGIQNLLTIELVSWKNMQEDDASANSEAETQVITVHGFEDSMFGTEDTFQAQTINHLGGFRAGDKASSYEVKRTDLSGVYVSKMYFDAVNRVGYYDEDTASSGQRLTTYTQGTMDSNHARQSHGNVQPEYGEQNCALNLGYKAQGSYLVDFRQVNSLDGPEYSCYMQYGSYRDNEQREISYYNDAIKPVSYNTGLQMTINQELPPTCSMRITCWCVRKRFPSSRTWT